LISGASRTREKKKEMKIFVVLAGPKPDSYAKGVSNV
jgi:hypothetical protein